MQNLENGTEILDIDCDASKLFTTELNNGKLCKIINI